MNSDCEKIKDQIADLVTGILPEAQVHELEQHLNECAACRDYARALKDEDMLLTEFFEKIDTDITHQQERVLQAINSFDVSKQSETHLIWRTITKSPITKLAAATVIIIAVVLSTTILDKLIPTASAAQVLAEAADAVANLQSVYIKVQMRTHPRGNFSEIRLDYDFVPIEIWKKFENEELDKWRLEEPGRVAVMDGKETITLFRPNYVIKTRARELNDLWDESLVEVDSVIARESRSALQRGSDLELFHKIGEDGYEKLVVVAEAKVQGDFTNDWLKNKSISHSDNLRIYTFDAKTKLLEGLKVYIHTEDEDVLVLELTDIEYDIDIDPALFELELPEGIIWDKEPEVLPDNEKYEKMTPKETAIAFFQACADEDWDEYLKFNPASAVPQKNKDYLGRLEIISIGEPFKSGLYPARPTWFVPYEIKLKSGQIKKYNLAVRNDNPAKRYVVDGGI